MLLGVVLRRVVRMLFGMGKVRVSHVRVMRGLVVIAGLMMLCGFGVVVGSQPVMMSGLLVMFDCLLRHGEISISARRLSCSPPAMDGSSATVKTACVIGDSNENEYALNGETLIISQLTTTQYVLRDQIRHTKLIAY